MQWILNRLYEYLIKHIKKNNAIEWGKPSGDSQQGRKTTKTQSLKFFWELFNGFVVKNGARGSSGAGGRFGRRPCLPFKNSQEKPQCMFMYMYMYIFNYKYIYIYMYLFIYTHISICIDFLLRKKLIRLSSIMNQNQTS